MARKITEGVENGAGATPELQLSGGKAHHLEKGFRVVVPTGATASVWSDNGTVTAENTEKNLFRYTGEIVETSLPLASVKVNNNGMEHMFSFFVSDVTETAPIWIPEYEAAVTTAEDERSYDEIVESIRAKGLRSKLERYEQEPQESFETAAAGTRDACCPMWLGIGQDIRLFALSFRGDFSPYGEMFEIRNNAHIYGARGNWIQPLFHRLDAHCKDNDDRNIFYSYGVGRGFGCADPRRRWLEDGCLPIVHCEQDDEDILYHTTAFVSYERAALTPENVTGTHFLVDDKMSACAALSAEQEKIVGGLMDEAFAEFDENEMVLYMRIEAKNTTSTPQYAFFTVPGPSTDGYQWWIPQDRALIHPNSYSVETGLGCWTETGNAYMTVMMDGKPLLSPEVSQLVMPGESVNFDIRFLHRPIPQDRALELAKVDFESKLAECKRYWKQKLAQGATLTLPDKVIEDKVRAGMIHLDITNFGKNPDGVVVASCGQYPAIGSESAPIIEMLDSMGWTDMARRCTNYFFERQCESGEIRCVDGYNVETSSIMGIFGRRYLYDRDDNWVRAHADQIKFACKFLLDWIDLNRDEATRGWGYGMISGRIADPVDIYHSYMLNAYTYDGLRGVAEMFKNCDPEYAAKIKAAADELRHNTREAFFNSMDASPVVPLNDGTWCPSSPPWPEYKGPVCLHAQGGVNQTHGAVQARDSMLGFSWLIYFGVLEPDELPARFAARWHRELMLMRNAAYSQPYYSRHDWIELVEGNVNSFLKAYYNTVASLADRSIHSFWEHYLGCTMHKTHEEAWFLMQTRWMLWLERGNELRLLSGVPDAWFADGEVIELDGAVSRFGKFYLRVERINGEQKVDFKWLSDVKGTPQVTLYCGKGRKMSLK